MVFKPLPARGSRRHLPIPFLSNRPAVAAVNRQNGKRYTVQYFERARFGLHPEMAGTPYKILFAQSGALVGAQVGALVGALVCGSK